MPHGNKPVGDKTKFLFSPDMLANKKRDISPRLDRTLFSRSRSSVAEMNRDFVLYISRSSPSHEGLPRAYDPGKIGRR